MQKFVDNFIQTTNALDIDGALSLFTPDAAIDDVSVGDAFVGSDGVRLYLERFFAGHNTRSRLLSIQRQEDSSTVVRSISQAILATRLESSRSRSIRTA